MITERIFIMRHRCNTRWIWREWSDFNRPLTPVRLSELPPELGKAVREAGRVYNARKYPKFGPSCFKDVWYKSRGYKLV